MHVPWRDPGNRPADGVVPVVLASIMHPGFVYLPAFKNYEAIAFRNRTLSDYNNGFPALSSNLNHPCTFDCLHTVHLEKSAS